MDTPLTSQFEMSVDESVEILKRVLPVMSQQKIPTIPPNYAVWYDYVTHRNDELSKEIESYLRTGQAFTPAICRSIYEQFYLDEVRAEVDGLRGAMRDAVETVLKELGEMDEGISHYSEVLDDCSEKIDTEISKEDLKNLILDLAKETGIAKTKSKEFEHSLGDMAEELADLRAQVSRLSRDSLTDALTSIANRRAFNQTLNKMMKEADMGKNSLCLVIGDIDHFKSFNDTYGHLVGDEVLRYVAAEMQQCVKGRDMLARYGGEEFALLLPSTRLEGAVMLAESIRTIIESEIMKDTEGNELEKVTISMGVAVFRPGEPAEDFIHRADECLYRSKELGRNRVTSERELLKPAEQAG